jgi:hypothetical protein
MIFWVLPEEIILKSYKKVLKVLTIFLYEIGEKKCA